jgi:hypothetical protein
MSVPATGNDANDGSAANKAKATWAGIKAILDKIDPAGFVVTVQVSGLVPGAEVNLPLYNSRNLIISGTSTAADGFSSRVDFYTGCRLDKIQGSFNVLADHVFSTTVIRLVGNGDSGVSGRSPGRFSATGTIEYEGTFGAIFAADSGVNFWLNGITYTQIGTPEFNYFAQASRSGVFIHVGTGTYNGDAGPAIHTYNVFSGGIIPTLHTAAPGDGTIAVAADARFSAKGVARAGCFIHSDGAMADAFGITSCTKTATGVYTLSHNLGTNTIPIATVSSDGRMARATESGAGTTVVRTYDAQNVAIDAAVNVAIF